MLATGLTISEPFSKINVYFTDEEFTLEVT